MTSAPARRLHLGVLLIILLAFGLRVYAIERQDIWGDEAFSIWLSSQPLSEVVAGGADTHPPLYPFLLYLWLRRAGSSPLATRFLSACIGALTVPVVYVMGRYAYRPLNPPRKRGASSAAAVLAAALVAVSPALIYYSQETRMYGLVTLLGAASVYWAMRALEEPRSWGRWMAYFATTLGAAYTHYYAFFVILAENLVIIPILLQRRRWPPLARWLGAQGAIVLTYLPWVMVQRAFLGGKASTRFEEWDLASALRIAGETLTAFGAGLAAPSTSGAAIVFLFLLAVAAGLVALLRLRQPKAWLIAAYLLLPLVLAWVVNPIMPFFYARYLLLIAPAFYLIAAGGVVAWSQLWRPLGGIGAALLLGTSLFGLSGYYTDDTHLKGQYGQMMNYVSANAQPGDGLLLANQLQRPLFEYYQPDGLEAYFFPRYEYTLEDPRTVAELAAIARQHPRLWLVRFGNPAEYDPDGFLGRWLATSGSRAYFGGWVDADLSLYVMTPTDAGTGDAIQHPLQADLGDQIRLLGYAVNSEQVAAGESLLLTLYWQALTPVAERYTVFTHLLDSSDQIRAQIDGEPQGGSLPTDRWTVGQVVQDNYALTVAPDTASGPHTLQVGMYLLETLDRLPVRDADTGTSLGDRVVLGNIEVVAP